jgi:hypothetical protein
MEVSASTGSRRSRRGSGPRSGRGAPRNQPRAAGSVSEGRGPPAAAASEGAGRNSGRFRPGARQGLRSPGTGRGSWTPLVSPRIRGFSHASVPSDRPSPGRILPRRPAPMGPGPLSLKSRTAAFSILREAVRPSSRPDKDFSGLKVAVAMAGALHWPATVGGSRAAKTRCLARKERRDGALFRVPEPLRARQSHRAGLGCLVLPPMLAQPGRHRSA